MSADREGGGRSIRRIIYPNYSALPAGSRHPLVIYEADEGGWEAYGYGRVTRDGRSIVPERGVRLRKLTGAGAVNAWIPAALDVLGNSYGDPVDASTGLFDYEKTDFVLPGPMPIRLTRLYRQSDMPVSGFQTPNKYMFGRMMSTNYEAYLYNPDFNPVTPQYTQMELILPGERRVHFDRTSLGSPNSFESAVFQATTTPGPFFKATIRWKNAWILARKDGTVLTFGGAPNLREIKDKFGNRVMVLGPGGSAPNPTSPSSYNPITQIVSYPSGRWLSFGYTNQLVTQVKDDLGRVANYTYDGSSRMLTATDPNQSGQQNPKSTTYTWQAITGCADQVMSSVTDPRQITFLSNTYSTNGTCRVTDQFVPTDTPGVTDNFHFDYTPIGQGSVTQTDITDPIGNVTRTSYDSTGYLTSQTDALGTPSARTFSYAYDPTTHRTASVTDSFHTRRTDYGYDNFGNLTSVTRLAGTGGAVTTNYTYDPVFHQLQTITDPLTHTTRFDYDTKGCLDIVTDPMNRQTLFDCNGAGQVTSVTDPLSHITQFAYVHGDLSTVTDPLSRATTRFTDAGGRVLSVTDPLNYATGYAYDNLNQLTKVTDPKGKAISFFYDEDGNLTQVKDERKRRGRGSSLHHLRSRGIDRRPVLHLRPHGQADCGLRHVRADRPPRSGDRDLRRRQPDPHLEWGECLVRLERQPDRRRHIHLPVQRQEPAHHRQAGLHHPRSLRLRRARPTGPEDRLLGHHQVRLRLLRRTPRTRSPSTSWAACALTRRSPGPRPPGPQATCSPTP